MHAHRLLLLWISVILLAGCTALGQNRTDHSAVMLDPGEQTNEILLQHCSPGKKGQFSGRELKNSIEDYGSHLIGFVEYSDQGWEYASGAQRRSLRQRLNADLADPRYARSVFINIVFVHGWHHNAEDGDCNVNEFRAMVRQVSRDLADAVKGAGLDLHFRVNGVYVGWRGEALRIPLLRQTSLITRRNSAEHIAKGSVRELFADLRAIEFAEPVRVRTIVVGHSFGALIAFHSLSPLLINDLALQRQRAVMKAGASGCGALPNAPRAWPDFTVLINPAFEASRFEALHNAAQAEPGCPHPAQRPKLVVVTADNDMATGKIFPLFRSVASIFEKYDASSREAHDNERQANLHAVGFVDRYKTHRLALERNDGGVCVRQYRDPAGKAQDRDSPVWVVGASKDIVFGHDGFLYPDAAHGRFDPYLLHWLLNVYLDAVAPGTSFHKLYEQYKKDRCIRKDAENEVIQRALRSQ